MVPKIAALAPIAPKRPGWCACTTFAPSDPTIVTHCRGDDTNVVRVEKSNGGLVWYVRAD